MSLGGRKPYSEVETEEGVSERTFHCASPEDDFVWHRDEEDRVVEVLSGNDWHFQFDNQLPVKLMPGYKIRIEKNEWHRIIKGSTDLTVRVYK